MKKNILIITVFWGSIFCFGNVAWAFGASGTHRLGGGLHYWVVVEDANVKNVNKDGLAFIVSYQYRLAEYLKLEADIEFLSERYNGNSVLTPLAYVLVGKGLYGGVGIGSEYSDGDFADTPLFAFRAGVDAEILPLVYLDINANYRSQKWASDQIDIDTDTVTLGAVVRFEF